MEISAIFGSGQGFNTLAKMAQTALPQGGGLTPVVGQPTVSGVNRQASPRDANNQQEKKGRFDKNDCQTCKNRRYQDGSNDGGVSFKTPTKISPGASAAAVASHESEHVFRERAKAKDEGRRVISQSVSYRTATCPECKKTYVSGGTTRTVTASDKKNKNEQAQNNQKSGFSAIA